MTALLKSFSVLCLCLGVAGCALERGDGHSCNLVDAPVEDLVAQAAFDPGDLQPTSVILGEDQFAPSMADAFRQTIEETAERVPRRAPIELEVLALSAGGQYGAFGAGFLRGWAENPSTPRPVFDLVTGVSAGGMLAPVAFSGRENDAVLDSFRGLHSNGVFRRRSLLALPGAPSFFDATPLQKMLTASLTDALIEDVAAQHAKGARLLVMATNLDTAQAQVFDLGEIASSPQPLAARRDCMTEVMLASAAIPGVFPPRNIDGTLFVDGGLRDQVFLREVESARASAARQTGREVRINATMVISGSLRVPEGQVRDSLLGYTERSLFVLSDEVLRDSINETISFAQNNENWTIKGVIAELRVEDSCPFSERAGTFDRCVTTALFDAGRALGRSAPIDFMTSAELRALADEF
jgi:predicted acylesterase/phospholipase RssA